MRDNLVTFPTANLARLKGFDWQTKRYFIDNKPSVLKYYRNSNLVPDAVSQPTQSLLQKWLRDVKGVFLTVTVDPDSKSYAWVLYQFETRIEKSVDEIGTWETALERGLVAALNLI